MKSFLVIALGLGVAAVAAAQPTPRQIRLSFSAGSGGAAGTSGTPGSPGGCNCSTSPSNVAWMLPLLVFFRRRRSPRR